jgi:hypothetical protein
VGGLAGDQGQEDRLARASVQVPEHEALAPSLALLCSNACAQGEYRVK